MNNKDDVIAIPWRQPMTYEKMKSLFESVSCDEMHKQHQRMTCQSIKVTLALSLACYSDHRCRWVARDSGNKLHRLWFNDDREGECI